MGRDRLIVRARRRAEQGMVDNCTVRRKTGETEGPGGVIEPTWDDVYTGRCRVQVRSDGAGNNADVGEAALVLVHHEVQLPIAAVGIVEGDQIEVTASVHDPDLVGRVYVVRTVLTKSEATARRVAAIEVTS